MKCFRHPHMDAVGVCKSCGKGLCLECVHDTGNGLACLESCIEEVEMINQILEVEKRACGIGQTSRPVSITVLMNYLFAALFGGWGLLATILKEELEIFPLIMAFGLFIVGFYASLRQKAVGLHVG